MSELNLLVTGTRDDQANSTLVALIIEAVKAEEQDELFCGFHIERETNEAGKLLSIRLLPCDNLDGIAAPRTQ